MDKLFIVNCLSDFSAQSISQKGSGRGGGRWGKSLQNTHETETPYIEPGPFMLQMHHNGAKSMTRTITVAVSQLNQEVERRPSR